MPVIPARSFASQRLKIGQSIRIINTKGSQVVDTWAFAVEQTPFPTYMSMVHTRSSLHKLLPSTGEAFLNNRRNPILALLEDTSPGMHDVLFAACSPERYVQLNASKEHDNCANNLYNAVKICEEPGFRKVQEFLEHGWMPDPLNLFMKVVIDDNKLHCEDPDSRPGDYVILRAEQECIVFMSACPMDVSACNGGEPDIAEFEVLS